MQRLVCDLVPARPSLRVRDSRRARSLRGDLDLITLMALRKEPERRYQTVEQFAADLRRWRDGLPVLAQPDTTRYRLRKFVARNRLALGAAALVFLSLVGGIAASLWQAREAERARDLAQSRYRDVRSLATNMMFEVDGAIATLPGSVHARRLVVSRALEHLDRLSKEMQDDPALLADVAMGYEKIADIQGSPFEFNLGDGDAALANARRALALRERAVALAPGIIDDAMVAALARSRMQLGSLIREARGSEAESEVHFASALATLEQRKASAARGGAVGLAYADALNLSGTSHFRQGEFPQASAAHAAALALADEVISSAPAEADVPAWTRTQAVSRLLLASARWWEGAKGDDVIAPMQASVLSLESLMVQAPGNARAIRQAAVAHAVLSDVIGFERDVGAAQPHTQRALALGNQLLSFDPQNPQTRRDMSRWQSLASGQLQGAGYWEAAEQHSREALRLMDGLIADQPRQFDLWAEGRTLRCKRAALLLQGSLAGFRGPAFSSEAVCQQALSCRRDLERKDLASPDFNPALLAQVVAAAGTCPAP
jgi:tetratricopeptide (TPR) repeat protein